MYIKELSASINSATLHELFREQARQTPDKIALVDKDVKLTYQELDQLTDRLADHLRRYQIVENDAIGILLEKCYEYIVACLAILKAGGAYLHLELAYPSNFLGQIFADAKPKVVITKEKYLHQVAPHAVSSLCIDRDEWRKAGAVVQATEASNRSVAIIGYSSGTTGKPKGICVSHRATIYAYAKFWEEVWHIQNKDRFAYTTFITWDALSPLMTGQTGYIVADEISFDPERLLAFIAQYQINHTVLTPSLLSTILHTVQAETIRTKLSSLNIGWVGGEVTTQPLVDETLELLPNLCLINNYGPVECFVITQGRLRAHDAATPSICSVGHVLDGMEVMIVDEAMHPVAHGEVGELYATGPCLADGYLNNPGLTRQKFIPINGKIFYKTGDSAKFLADGRLMILGRRDSTVKIRSYNVNLLAIEETLKQSSQIADCVVVAYGDEGDDKYLVAYLIRSEGATWKIDPQTSTCPDMSSYLRDHLPFYAIPHVYIEQQSFPLHPISQKLDKSSLPLPEFTHKNSGVKERIQIAETSIAQQEQIIGSLLEEILHQNAIKNADNFFEIGLHSLMAARFAARLKETFAIDVSVAKIYEHSTIRELVAHINSSSQHRPTISWHQDATLGEISLSGLPPRSFSAVSQAVFLTGATGFLGVFLLAELLQISPTIKVYCLVRTEDGLQRLVAKLRFFRLWRADFEERIHVLTGTLEEPYFGWSQHLFEQHAQKMDAIFHVGAWVNMVYPYHKLKPTNVDGTREVIRFASCKIAKSLHHVSTLGIIPAGNVAMYAENEQIDPLIKDLTSGYAQSKWVAEKLVWQAVANDIPAQVYRIGNIGPDSQTHLANDNDTMMVFLDTCKKLRMAPRRDDWRFEYTPVDFVAKAIVQTALCERPVSSVYHIASQQLVAANDVFAEMRSQGSIDQVVDFDLWAQHLRELAQQQSGTRYDLLAQSLAIEEEFLLEEEPFDTSLFIAQVQRCQLLRPVVDENYLIQAILPSSLP